MTLLVNFGGPRDLNEVAPFLCALLTDPDVIRTKLPYFAQRWLFRRIARKRALSVSEDYAEIGGRSPIFFETEEIGKKLGAVCFHRYLTQTHAESLAQIEAMPQSEIKVIPLFPQFCYATTGSIARFFEQNLSRKTVNKLRWVKSYAAHPAFVRSYQRRIREFIDSNKLDEKETLLLFSAHGVPQSFIDKGDIYESECRLSFQEVLKAFPNAEGLLSYQSRFGPEEWIKPYTNEVCETNLKGKKNVVVVPISFTSDHIETLFEIEKLYLPVIRKQGINAYRCPALNLEPYWIEALSTISESTDFCTNQMLIRK